MADFTGFNPNDITQSIKNMNSNYSELSSIYNSKLKKFVEDVSTGWACPEAKTFFNTDFKTITTSLGRNIENQFSFINELMNNAAQAWCRTTSSSAFTKVPFQNGLIKEVDVSIIKDNINGDIGIDGERVTSLASSFLADLSSSIDSVLKKCRNISNGFLGGNQRQALDNRINIVSNSIVESIKDQMSKLVANVNNTAQKYQTNAGNVTSYFESESGVGTAASGIGSSVSGN
jgi:hypothetical protein